MNKKLLQFLTTLSLALILAVSPCMFKLNSAKQSLRTTTIEVTQQSINYESILNEFDNAELVTNDSLTTFVGYKAINLSELNELNNVSETDVQENTEVFVRYNFSYDSETNIVTLSAEMQNEQGEIIIDTITGVAFLNEHGNIDAILDVDGDYILLSELQDAGMIENCGWFSKIIKKVIIAVVAVVVVSAVVAVVVATAGAGLGAVIAAGAIAGGVTGGVAGGVISYQETGEVKLWAVLAGIGVGAVIGAATGYGVYQAAAALKITNALKVIEPNRINHILQAKHNWSLLGKSSWEVVSKAIEATLATGSVIEYEAGNKIITAIYNGQTVQVVVRIVNDVFTIVDAWIKTI